VTASPSSSADRHVPALVLLVGVVLALGALAFGLVSTGDVARSLATAVLLLYPPGAYAVHVDDDPAGTLPPALVAGGAAVAALVAGLLLAAEAPPARRLAGTLYAVTVALVLFLPAATYATRYGDPPARLPPRRVAVGATLLALLFLAGGVAGAAPGYGAVSAVMTFLAGTLFAHAQGVRLRRRTRRAAVVAGLLLGTACVAVAASGVRRDALPIAALAAILAPAVAFAATAPGFGRGEFGFGR